MRDPQCIVHNSTALASQFKSTRMLMPSPSGPGWTLIENNHFLCSQPAHRRLNAAHFYTYGRTGLLWSRNNVNALWAQIVNSSSPARQDDDRARGVSVPDRRTRVTMLREKQMYVRLHFLLVVIHFHVSHNVKHRRRRGIGGVEPNRKKGRRTRSGCATTSQA